jgi:hypothetical protein
LLIFYSISYKKMLLARDYVSIQDIQEEGGIEETGEHYEM